MREVTLNKKGVLNMKPDYKNWIPKGMLVSLIAGTVLSLALLLVFGVFGIGVRGKLRVVLGVVFGIAFVVCAKYTQRCADHCLRTCCRCKGRYRYQGNSALHASEI